MFYTWKFHFDRLFGQIIDLPLINPHDAAVCKLSLRCHIQASRRQWLIKERPGRLFPLHILFAPKSQLHDPHAHGQRHAYWQSPGPLFHQGPAHLSQADAALQPGFCLPTGEYWTGNHWDPCWPPSGRACCSAAALPLSLPPSGWVSFKKHGFVFKHVDYEHALVCIHSYRNRKGHTVSQNKEKIRQKKTF